MIQVIMNGYAGKMGQTISALAAQDPEIEIVAGIDLREAGQPPYPVFRHIGDCRIPADCLIDFSNAAGTDRLLDYCVENRLPCVLCTTGFSQEQLGKIREAAQVIPVLQSANMSLGVNLLLKILKEAAHVLVPGGFDVEIVEKHHNQKLDSPSGTALALADAINQEFSQEYGYVYDRSVRREKRRRKEIGISTVRGGSIVGEHEVIFAGSDEVVTFSHTAYSKAIFGKGAIQAAKFLARQEAGMYDMGDVVRS
ncbi:MAG: 4-hydroxy-tetrahydrodipicolinate reductase [Clostridium sp.]|jgi:4-hydroxy-tetrahydrodipicolinate reductase|nr:4-hydroxy-tetrahydrodipicolinate reductase [Clostridium sp.]